MRNMTLSLLASTIMATAVGAQDAPTDQSTSPVEQPDATVDLSGGTFAVGVGFVWGSGTLHYDGAQHAFKFSGVSVIDAGGAHINATGDVYHLQNLQDFAGHYTIASAGVTVAGGGSLAVVRNEHGVVIKLHATSTGLRFNVASEGVRIKFQS